MIAFYIEVNEHFGRYFSHDRIFSLYFIGHLSLIEEPQSTNSNANANANAKHSRRSSDMEPFNDPCGEWCYMNSVCILKLCLIIMNYLREELEFRSSHRMGQMERQHHQRAQHPEQILRLTQIVTATIYFTQQMPNVIGQN